jgi:uncharacterized membrane protein
VLSEREGSQREREMSLPDQLTRSPLPSREDPVARAASAAIGGPWGRHAVVGQRWFWTPLRVLLAMTLFTLLLGWLQKEPCQSGNWQHSLQYTHFCYSDVIPLFFEEKLNSGAIPYVDHAVEYPVLTGAFMGLAAWLGRGYAHVAAATDGALPGMPPVQAYFTMTVLLLAACMLVVTWSTAALAGRRIWDAAMVALAPLLVVHAYTNWDLFAVALAGAGLVAWQRRRPGVAGVLLGLGTAAKLYPVLFLLPLLALCVRTRRLGAFGRTFAGAALAWLAVNLPIAVMYPAAWRRFFELNRSRSADFDTLWYGFEFLTARQQHRQAGTVQVNGLATVAVVAVLGAVVVLALRARRRPRLPQLLFLTVAGFLLVNKVWSPQYSLWLVPLAVLARPSWRPFLIWQAAECLVWVPRLLWFLGTGSKGVDYQWFLLAVLIRDVALIGYCVLVIQDILRPDRDIVRAAGADDPAGGVLDGVPDSEYAALAWLRPSASPASTAEPGPGSGSGPGSEPGVGSDPRPYSGFGVADLPRDASGDARKTT